jgi:hypothetical protein
MKIHMHDVQVNTYPLHPIITNVIVFEICPKYIVVLSSWDSYLWLVRAPNQKQCVDPTTFPTQDDDIKSQKDACSQWWPEG